ncbi:MAG: DUF2218 domain-containing protein [Chloroflexota bacterium]
MTQTLPQQIIDGALAHMNDDHRDNILNYAKVLAGCDWATAAEMTTLDANGFNMLVHGDGREETHRIDFDKPVTDGKELRGALVGLAMKADLPDGIRRVATAEVDTPNAIRYVKALSNHFNRKADGNYEGNRGVVNFAFGDAELKAIDGTIHMRVAAESDMMFARVKDVVGGHLERFAQKEELSVEWQDAA